MTDDELMQATLLALTRQNVVRIEGGSRPKEVTIGYVDMVFRIEIWTGEMITGTFYRVN